MRGHIVYSEWGQLEIFRSTGLSVVGARFATRGSSTEFGYSRRVSGFSPGDFRLEWWLGVSLGSTTRRSCFCDGHEIDLYDLDTLHGSAEHGVDCAASR
jgi:hypothetical protein